MNDFLQTPADEEPSHAYAKRLLSRGQTYLLSAIFAILVANVTLTVIYVSMRGADRLWIQSLRFVLTSLLLWQVYLGKRWARRLTIGLFIFATVTGFGAFVDVVTSSGVSNPFTLGIVTAMSCVYPVMVYLLMANRPVIEFLDSQRHTAE